MVALTLCGKTEKPTKSGGNRERRTMLSTEDSVVVFVDVQGRLAESIADRESVHDRLDVLLRAARLLEVPIIATEQLPEKIGPTLPRFAELLKDAPIISKSTFNCCEAPAFTDTLRRMHRMQIVLAGLEAHICISQTAQFLLTRGYQVFIACDAVSSRRPMDRDLAFQRLCHAGACIPLTVEMALFEWMRAATHPKFKDILKLITAASPK